MVALGVNCLPEAICESEGQARDLLVTDRHAIMRQRMLVHNQVI